MALIEFQNNTAPYLNAENLNNNFNYIDAKHNYSSDEKVVGKYIDNKPLYQKVVPITITHTASTSTQNYYLNHNIANVDKIFINKGTSFNNNGSAVDSLYVDGGNITYYMRNTVNTTQIRTDLYYNANSTENLIIVLNYTKTTD